MAGIGIHVAQEREAPIAALPVGGVLDEPVDVRRPMRGPFRIVFGNDGGSERKISVMKMMIVQLQAGVKAGWRADQAVPRLVVIERPRQTAIEPILQLVFQGLQEVIASVQVAN